MEAEDGYLPRHLFVLLLLTRVSSSHTPCYVRGLFRVHTKVWVCHTNVKDLLQIHFVGFGRMKEKKKLLWRNAMMSYLVNNLVEME